MESPSVINNRIRLIKDQNPSFYEIDPNIKDQKDRSLQAVDLLRVSLNNFLLRYSTGKGVHGEITFPVFHTTVGQDFTKTPDQGTGSILYVSSNNLGYPHTSYINTVQEGQTVLVERIETLFNLHLQLSYVVRVPRLQDWVSKRFEAQRRLASYSRSKIKR